MTPTTKVLAGALLMAAGCRFSLTADQDIDPPVPVVQNVELGVKAEDITPPVTDAGYPLDGTAWRLHPYRHATFSLTGPNLTILVDPVPDAFQHAPPPQAGLILVTDVHPDHLNVDLLKQLAGPKTVVVAPQAVVDQLPDGIDAKPLANEHSLQEQGVQIQAVAMYNNHRGPDPGKLYHEKGRGNGYLLTLEGHRLYISGDTACTPEMRGLHDIDTALVCMNLPYTMPPEEAAACVNAFHPKVVIPYHHRGQDPAEFTRMVEGSKVRLLSWYGDPAN